MSHSDKIRLVIVIPVYGNWEDTLATLRSLERQDCREFRVVVADDGTPEEAPDEVHDFAFATYVKGPNAGFAGNCNRAARMAIESGATHILFLNNDTDFSSEFVGGWLRAAEALPGAIVSPNVYWYSRPEAVWFSGGAMSMWTPFVRLAREYRETTQVEIVCGCVLLVPVAEWEQLNGFDERFKVYFEDFDLALRAKAAGIPIFVDAAPEVRTWHKVSGSFRKGNAWAQQYYLLTSRLQFIRRHFRWPMRAVCYVLVVLHLLAVFLDNVPEIPSPKLVWRAAARGMAGGAG